jgi:hypothetical protein
MYEYIRNVELTEVHNSLWETISSILFTLRRIILYIHQQDCETKIVTPHFIIAMLSLTAVSLVYPYIMIVDVKN